MSAYTSNVNLLDWIAIVYRYTFKKNQSTRTCWFDPAIRIRRIRMRVRKQRIGGMKPRILTLLHFVVQSWDGTRLVM